MKQRTTYIGLALMLAVELLCGLLWWHTASAQEPPFKLERPSCYPIVSAAFRTVIDARIDMGGELDVGIWYCDAVAGMEAYFRAGSFGQPCDECFKADIKSLDQLYDLDKAAFSRPLNEPEAAKVRLMEQRYEPRCVMDTPAITTGVRSLTIDRKLGPARVDADGVKISITVATAKPSCWQWLRAKAGDAVRYCSVSGQFDTQGREIGPDSYVPCRLAKAPANGWPQ